MYNQKKRYPPKHISSLLHSMPLHTQLSSANRCTPACSTESHECVITLTRACVPPPGLWHGNMLKNLYLFAIWTQQSIVYLPQIESHATVKTMRSQARSFRVLEIASTMWEARCYLKQKAISGVWFGVTSLLVARPNPAQYCTETQAGTFMTGNVKSHDLMYAIPHYH